MAIEKPAMQNTSAEIDATRQEAVRKRALAEEWSGTAIADLTNAVAKLNAQAPVADTQTTAKTLGISILTQCENVLVAAEVAAASVMVAGRERAELAAESARIDADIETEVSAVKHLRKVLERERRQVDRRLQYEALGKVIMAEPPANISQKQLDDAQREHDAVQREAKMVEEQRELLSKEFRLLLNCSANLGQLSVELAAMMNEHKSARDASST